MGREGNRGEARVCVCMCVGEKESSERGGSVRVCVSVCVPQKTYIQ